MNAIHLTACGNPAQNLQNRLSLLLFERIARQNYPE